MVRECFSMFDKPYKGIFALYSFDPFLYFFLYFYLCIYLVGAGLSCGMWDLVHWAGIEPRPPALEVWSLSHWTTREVSWPISFTHKGLLSKEFTMLFSILIQKIFLGFRVMIMSFCISLVSWIRKLRRSKSIPSDLWHLLEDSFRK